MKRILIKNLQGTTTHMGQAEDADAWINAILPTGAWGNPDNYTITIEDMQAEIDAETARIAEIQALRQRVRNLSALSDLTAAQIKEALMKFLKMLDLEDRI